MPTKNVLTESRYARLVRDVRKLIEEGKTRAVQAARQELARTYWEIGRRITQEGLTDASGYGDAVLRDISEELGMDYTTLVRCILFFKTYNVAPRGNILMWTHYKALIALRDGEARQWYETWVEERNLNGQQLRNAIKDNRFDAHQKSKGKKAPPEILKRPVKPTYVYKAYVKRVIDGDTILLHVDLGFQVLKVQRVRLAGIDTPPMDQPGGREAYRYVRDQLAKTDFVMIKTNKIDIYGRYIAHVFYSFTEQNKNRIFEQGRYLNQELLDKGLAKLF